MSDDDFYNLKPGQNVTALLDHGGNKRAEVVSVRARRAVVRLLISGRKIERRPWQLEA